MGAPTIDWNNGPGPSEYYPNEYRQDVVIYTLLMHGVSGANGIAIPRGSVYGVGGVSTATPFLDLIPVGRSSISPNPTHN